MTLSGKVVDWSMLTYLYFQIEILLIQNVIKIQFKFNLFKIICFHHLFCYIFIIFSSFKFFNIIIFFSICQTLFCYKKSRHKRSTRLVSCEFHNKLLCRVKGFFSFVLTEFLRECKTLRASRWVTYKYFMLTLRYVTYVERKRVTFVRIFLCSRCVTFQTRYRRKQFWEEPEIELRVESIVPLKNNVNFTQT